MTTTTENPCATCGSTLTEAATGRRRRYCSDACRMRAFRARRAPAASFMACEVDGTPIEAGGRGRRARYCSDACRMRAYRARRSVVTEAETITRDAAVEVPAELREQDRWVRWIVTKQGQKLPLRADRNRAASSTDPRTWTSYTAARDSSVGTGLGFVLGDGAGCIDLDDCLDAEDRLSEFAAGILALNPNAWVERSMSGRGLHVFGLLDEAPGRRTKGLEIYSRSRFIALTGDVFRPGRLVPLVVPEA